MPAMRDSVSVLVVALLLTGCGGERTPNRNQIPYLKTALFDLQEVVKSRRAASIDSMLTGELKQLGSDSLLGFVYGSDAAFAFEQFGGNVIAYTDENARIDCFIMDSLQGEDRPISFSLTFDNDHWLFTKIESGQGIDIRDSDDESGEQ